MEITEGNVRVISVPEVTIDDKPLQACSNAVLQRAFMELVRRIQSQRDEIAKLNSYITGNIDAAE